MKNKLPISLPLLLLALALAAPFSLAANPAPMPTQAELTKTQPLVNELMRPYTTQLKARTLQPEAVGDKAVEFADAADSDAARFLFLRGSIHYFARARAYDKAADAIEAIEAGFDDVPPDAILKLAASATERAAPKDAPRLFAIRRRVESHVKCATARRAVIAQMRRNPDDKSLVRRHAELSAAVGEWDMALKSFVRVGGAVGRTAQGELDGSTPSAELADFWWAYKPLEADAAAAIRAHAASHYRAALDAGELDGLVRTLAEQRLAEVAPSDAPAAKPVARTAAAAKATPAPTPTQKYKFVYRLNDKGNAILAGGNLGGKSIPCVSPEPVGTLVVPNAIDGHPVVSMEHFTLVDCDKITRLVLPKDLEWIFPNAIQGCHAIERIEIAASNNSYVSIDGVLYSKDKRTLVCYPKTRKDIRLIPGVKEIKDCAFVSCSFKTARLPEGVEVLRWWSMAACPNLEEVYLPKSVGWIDPYQFGYCPNLKKVIFLGNAPGLHVRKGHAIFAFSQGGFVVEVTRGSKGWAGNDSTDLPDRWPLVGHDCDRRPIRYAK